MSILITPTPGERRLSDTVVRFTDYHILFFSFRSGQEVKGTEVERWLYGETLPKNKGKRDRRVRLCVLFPLAKELLL